MLANAVYQFFIVIVIAVGATLGAILYFQRGGLKRGSTTAQPAGMVAGTERAGRPPLSLLTRLTMLALIGAAVGASFGVIEGIVFGQLHWVLPLALGLVYLLGAGLIATRIRWMVLVGLVYALVMLMGAAVGYSWIIFRLFHSEDLLRYIEIWVELTFTLLAAVVGIAAIVQDLSVRRWKARLSHERQ